MRNKVNDNLLWNGFEINNSYTRELPDSSSAIVVKGEEEKPKPVVVKRPKRAAARSNVFVPSPKKNKTSEKQKEAQRQAEKVSNAMAFVSGFFNPEQFNDSFEVKLVDITTPAPISGFSSESTSKSASGDELLFLEYLNDSNKENQCGNN